MKKSLFIIFLILFLDQFLKIWIKLNMFIGQEYAILGNWFIIHFTENNGMAFGMEFEWLAEFGKLALSLFRIVAIAGICWFLYDLIRKKAPKGIIISISMIVAGALGNILDSAFYGMIFNDSNYQVATFLPETGGYSSFLHGKVVDMFYFPMIRGTFPDWFPIWTNESFIFFRPVFNIADASITLGVANILMFQRKYFNTELKDKKVN